MMRTSRWARMRRLCRIAAVGLGAVVLGCGGDQSGGGGRPQSVCTDCSDTEGYRVTFADPWVGAEHPTVVLFSGLRNGHCRKHDLCIGDPDVVLGDVGWGPRALRWDCPPGDEELIAFASGMAPQQVSTLSGDANVSFAPATQVDVTLYLVTYSTNPAQAPSLTLDDVRQDGDRASSLFASLGTGMALSVKAVEYHPGATNGPFDVTTGCTQADEISRLGGNAYAAKRLNVYYVASLVEGMYAGMTCTFEGHPEVMFVSSTSHYPLQVAHELGHALGLVRSTRLPWNPTTQSLPGDIDGLHLDDYLDQYNLMYSGGTDFRTLTIGQIYRMHFDELSWLNRSVPLSSLPGGYPRKCQDSPVAEGDCPPLTLHPPRGWP